MRAVLNALLLGGLIAFAPASTWAGMPNPSSSTNAFGVSITVTNPQPVPVPIPLPVNPYSPAYSSQPIVNWPICPGDQVTAFLLNYCGGSIGDPDPGNGVPSTVAGPNLTNTGNGTTTTTQTTTTTTITSPSSCGVGYLCVSAASNICWSGTDGGFGVVSPTGGIIPGPASSPGAVACGNASYYFGVLQAGNMIGGAVSPSLSTPGTVTLTANCGGIAPIGFSTDTTSPPMSGPTVSCTAP